MNTNLQRLIALQNFTGPRGHRCPIGMIVECALDNAGFNGQHLDQMTEEALAEVMFFVTASIDSKQLEDINAQEWFLAEQIIKGI